MNRYAVRHTLCRALTNLSTTYMTHTTSVQKIVALVVGAVLLAVPLVSMAKSNDRGNSGNTQTGKEIHISNDGTVLVRGATVTAVSGNTVTATTAWGSANVTWTLKTDNAEFLRMKGSGERSDVVSGHMISFAGTLDQATGAFTVNAQVVKDWSVANESTIKGSVSSIATSTSSFVLSTKDGAVTVSTTGSTTIALENGSNAAFGDIFVNREAKVTGAYNAGAKTMAAHKIVLGNSSSNNNSWKKLLNFQFGGWFKSNR